MAKIGNGVVVAFRYIMRNSRQELLEDTMAGPPTLYLHGSEMILPGLQVQLEGMMPGETGRVELHLDTGHFTFDVMIDNVRQATGEEILLGYPVQAEEDVCGPDCSCHNAPITNNNIPGRDQKTT